MTRAEKMRYTEKHKEWDSVCFVCTVPADKCTGVGRHCARAKLPPSPTLDIGTCGREPVPINDGMCGVLAAANKTLRRMRRKGANLGETPVTIGGLTKTVAEWCAETGIPVATVESRRRRGMSLEEACTKKPRRQSAVARKNIRTGKSNFGNFGLSHKRG